MNILYAIQGTGNGHFSRAREFIPYLSSYGKLDLLVSGSNVEVDLGYPIQIKKSGISYTFGKNGGIDYIDTIKNLKPLEFISDLRNLEVDKYDLIINDYEPVTAWAAKRKKIPCIALSHQAAFLSTKTPRPTEKNRFTEFLFKKYAPCNSAIAFHYKRYDHFIHPPVIRSQIRNLKPETGRHITVYLPAWSEDALIPVFQRFSNIQWHIFSKHARSNSVWKNVLVQPVNEIGWLESLRTCWAVLSGGGFEAPAEALYLNKKVLIVPMRDQYEQKCNAEALKQLGIHVVPKIGKRFADDIKAWLEASDRVELDFPDHAEEIARLVIESTSNNQSVKNVHQKELMEVA
jgi:uncharacterized protein (TIGR00661 family)